MTSRTSTKLTIRWSTTSSPMSILQIFLHPMVHPPQIFSLLTAIHLPRSRHPQVQHKVITIRHNIHGTSRWTRRVQLSPRPSGKAWGLRFIATGESHRNNLISPQTPHHLIFLNMKFSSQLNPGPRLWYVLNKMAARPSDLTPSALPNNRALAQAIVLTYRHGFCLNRIKEVSALVKRSW